MDMHKIFNRTAKGSEHFVKALRKCVCVCVATVIPAGFAFLSLCSPLVVEGAFYLDAVEGSKYSGEKH